jgi:hypothetical protein
LEQSEHSKFIYYHVYVLLLIKSDFMQLRSVWL